VFVVIFVEMLSRDGSTVRLDYRYLFIYLFYYENRTQGTLKTIKKNKEQSTTG